MSSAYTSIFEDKQNVTFAEFVWRCARGFGAFIHMRDESLDKPPRKPGEKDTSDGYHAKELAEALLSLREAEKLTVKAATDMARTEFNKAKQEWDNMVLKRTALRKRLEKVLAQAKAWEPPTKDHERLKTYMIEQLEETIKWDCTIDEQFEPKLLTGQEYIAKQKKAAQWSVDYHTKQLERAKPRRDNENEWIDQLQDSVPYPGGRF